MRAFLAAFALMLATPVWADSNLPPAEYADQQLPNPAQEAAAMALMHEIRCLVCQGQSIADSDAELAGDMRSLIRQRIAAGEKPADVRRWLVERYGDWVTFSPPVKPLTWPLWAAPIILMLIGGAIAAKRLRKRK